MGTRYLHRLGISVIPYLDDWLVHHLDRQVLSRHQDQLIGTLDLFGFILNRKKSELDWVQDLQFLGIRSHLDLGEASLPESKAREIAARARHLSSIRVLSYNQVSQLIGSPNWASGLIPLGRLYLRPLQRHFHSLGLADWFMPPRHPDPLALANLLRCWQDLRFLTSGILSLLFRRNSRFSQTPPLRGEALAWGFHINCLELKAVVATIHHWAPVLQGHQVMVATDNSKVVSYINKHGGSCSPTLLLRASLVVRSSEHWRS